MPSKAEEKMSDISAESKETAGQVRERAKESGRKVMDEARTRAKTMLSDQKHRAAEGMGSMADAIRQMGSQLREKDREAAANYLDKAADQVERISSIVRDKDIDDLVYGAQDAARRRPGLFLGGAFALGFLAARFAKSSSERRGGYSGWYATRYRGRREHYPPEGHYAEGGGRYTVPERSGPYYETEAARAGESFRYGERRAGGGGYGSEITEGTARPSYTSVRDPSDLRSKEEQ
jgi:hypothetical protein